MDEKVYKGRREMLPEEVELPTFVSHKRARAAVIVALSYLPGEEKYRLSLEGGNYVDVSKLWVSKHTPQPGGVYVQYEDGYSSYSPVEAFKEGYTPADGHEEAVDAEGPSEAQAKAMVARIDELETLVTTRNGELTKAQEELAAAQDAVAKLTAELAAEKAKPSAADLDKTAEEAAAADATNGEEPTGEK